jgi:hypothetical protein
MPRQLFAPDLLELFIKGMNEVFPAIQPKSAIPSDGQQVFLETFLLEAEQDFGIISACGLFFRCGGAAFKHLVRQHGKRIGIDSIDFRLQPQQKRLMDGTQKIVHQLESWQAGKFSIQNTDELVEITASSSLATGSESQHRIWLHFVAGLFQEYLSWAGSGKQYPFQVISPEQPGNGIIIQFRIVPVD